MVGTQGGNSHGPPGVHVALHSHLLLRVWRAGAWDLSEVRRWLLLSPQEPSAHWTSGVLGSASPQ